MASLQIQSLKDKISRLESEVSSYHSQMYD